jgi:hypothetical protein
VPHPPDFLCSFVGSLNFMRLSLKLTTGLADPRGDETGFVLAIHTPPHTDSGRVPHVRTSVRGLSKTGRSPIKGLSFPLSRNELFFSENRTRGPVQSCVQEIRGISLVFREMWDTAGLPLKPVAN